MIEIIDNAIKLSGRIDSSNAKQFEEEIDAISDAKDITIDAGKLEYISSAGLRVLIKLRKTINGELSIINTSKDVYDIFDMTGITRILTVKKALRNMSIEGLEIIGKGATGSVYRIDNDTIIKVFNKNIKLNMIKRENEKAKNAFLFGVPTAISYDIVKVGECYGVVYEMLNADDLVNVIQKDREHLEDHIRDFALKMREMHTIEVDDRFEDAKARTINLMEYLDGSICTAEEVEKLRAVIENVPDRNTFIHGDGHIGNVMLQNGEYMFIDLGASSKGHPIFDMVSMCLTFKLGQNASEEVKNNTELLRGFTRDEIKCIWDTYLKAYLNTEDDEYIKRAEAQIMAVTGARITMAAVVVPGMFKPAQIESFKNLAINYFDNGIEPLCF